MLKKTIKYTDYNDVERTEDFYFNFSEAELMEMAAGQNEFQESVQKMMATTDKTELFTESKKLILMSIGKRTPDGRFEKSDEIRREFESSAAFSALFVELGSQDGAAAIFVNGIMPAKLRESLEARSREGQPADAAAVIAQATSVAAQPVDPALAAMPTPGRVDVGVPTQPQPFQPPAPQTT
jgi:hypothetical protein